MEKKLRQTKKHIYSANLIAPETYEKQLLYIQKYDYTPNGELEKMTHDYGLGGGESYEIHYCNGKSINGHMRCEHDEQGRLIAEIMENGEVTRHQYNEDGSHIELHLESSDSDGEQEVGRNEYDSHGNLVYEASVDPSGEGYVETLYTYNEDNQLVFEECTICTGIAHKGLYTYDESGQCIRELRVNNSYPYYMLDEERPGELDETQLFYEVIEHSYNADGTVDTNVYTCQATSMDDFFAGNYSKELCEVYKERVEEAIEGDHKIKTFKYYQNDQLKAIEVVTFGLDNDDAPLSCIRTDINDPDEYEDIEECNITETFFEYWD